jgi:hypothetical protein
MANTTLIERQSTAARVVPARPWLVDETDDERNVVPSYERNEGGDRE